jgi:cell division protein FtsI/penicillin-binding protein 2
MRSRLVLPFVVLVVLLAGGCLFSGSDDAARKAADRVALALERGDLRGVPVTGKAPDRAHLTALLHGFRSRVSVRGIRTSRGTATATLAWVQTLDGATWRHATTAKLVDHQGVWALGWRNDVLATGLGVSGTLQVSSVTPTRGRILGAGGVPLVEPRAVMRFGIDKEQVVGGPQVAAASARRLATLLGITPGPYVKQVVAAGKQAFVEALVLRRAEATQRIMLGVTAIPGARGIADHLPLAPAKDFAAAILGTVGPVTAELVKASHGRLQAGDDAGLSGLELRYDVALFGRRGLKVTAFPEAATNPGGPGTTVFFRPAIAGTDLRTTLDPTLEATAQRLLAGIGPASALVAIRPSTGAIIAAASGPGSNGYNTATFGQYAPGSTFKVISSLALLRAGLTPSSVVDCPTSVDVDGKVFKNYSDYPPSGYGRIPLTRALANSCNTAYVGQRARITGGALADAAAALGFGVDHDLGFPAYFGQVPAPGSATEAAADLIGQGRVLASPLAMAAVVASVARGATVVPSLLAGQPAATASPARPLTAREAAQLRLLMHAVVTGGTGVILQSLQPPAVIAKTGTAEYGTASSPGAALPTHAWMIAAQGDLAVAVFVATGDTGSHTAGPILKAFLQTAH